MRFAKIRRKTELLPLTKYQPVLYNSSITFFCQIIYCIFFSFKHVLAENYTW
jgi:hypothetical protein